MQVVTPRQGEVSWRAIIECCVTSTLEILFFSVIHFFTNTWMTNPAKLRWHPLYCFVNFSPNPCYPLYTVQLNYLMYSLHICRTVKWTGPAWFTLSQIRMRAIVPPNRFLSFDFAGLATELSRSDIRYSHRAYQHPPKLSKRDFRALVSDQMSSLCRFFTFYYIWVA